MSDSESPEMRILDAALAEALRPPGLPPGFERRLARALATAPQADENRASRASLEREHLERLAELEADYVRLRRRTLGTAIGAAFAAGAVAAVAMPWLQASLGGPTLLYVLGGAGTLLGVALAAASLGAGRLGGLSRLLE
ncbi:MAG TPA: hypothetical protein VMU40_17355 [Steroidobacteraceae bacterium]|nr:hypothetical protein [Steroidobacteraceae bacterium]